MSKLTDLLNNDPVHNLQDEKWQGFVMALKNTLPDHDAEVRRSVEPEAYRAYNGIMAVVERSQKEQATMRETLTRAQAECSRLANELREARKVAP